MTKHDNTNSGGMYPAEHMTPVGRRDDLKVIRQGKVDIEGADTEMVITQATSKEGKTYFEVYEVIDDRALVVEVAARDGSTYYKFYKKIGPIYVNDRKRTDKDADMQGTVTPNGGEVGEYMIWGRKRTTRDGVPMTSVSLAPKKEKPATSDYEEAYRNKEASGVPDNVNDDPTPPVSNQGGGGAFDDDDIPF